jgi:phosphopantetheine adenylyltransferase
MLLCAGITSLFLGISFKYSNLVSDLIRNINFIYFKVKALTNNNIMKKVIVKKLKQ